MKTHYLAEAPQRAEIDAMTGPVLLEFGANWCGHCQAAQAPLAQAFAGHAQHIQSTKSTQSTQSTQSTELTHYKVEDGPGRPLGRSFRVKLWPTMIFMRDGVEVARVVRPVDAAEIEDAMRQIAAQV